MMATVQRPTWAHVSKTTLDRKIGIHLVVDGTPARVQLNISQTGVHTIDYGDTATKIGSASAWRSPL